MAERNRSKTALAATGQACLILCGRSIREHLRLGESQTLNWLVLTSVLRPGQRELQKGRQRTLEDRASALPRPDVHSSQHGPRGWPRQAFVPPHLGCRTSAVQTCTAGGPGQTCRLVADARRRPGRARGRSMSGDLRFYSFQAWPYRKGNEMADLNV